MQRCALDPNKFLELYKASQSSPALEKPKTPKLFVNNSTWLEETFLPENSPEINSLDFLKFALKFIITLGIGPLAASISLDRRIQESKDIAELVFSMGISDSNNQTTFDWLYGLSVKEVTSIKKMLFNTHDKLGTAEVTEKIKLSAKEQIDRTVTLHKINDDLALVVKKGVIYVTNTKKKQEELVKLLSHVEFADLYRVPLRKKTIMALEVNDLVKSVLCRKELRPYFLSGELTISKVCSAPLSAVFALSCEITPQLLNNKFLTPEQILNLTTWRYLAIYNEEWGIAYYPAEDRLLSLEQILDSRFTSSAERLLRNIEIQIDLRKGRITFEKLVQATQEDVLNTEFYLHIQRQRIDSSKWKESELSVFNHMSRDDFLSLTPHAREALSDKLFRQSIREEKMTLDEVRNSTPESIAVLKAIRDQTSKRNTQAYCQSRGWQIDDATNTDFKSVRPDISTPRYSSYEDKNRRIFLSGKARRSDIAKLMWQRTQARRKARLLTLNVEGRKVS